MLDYSKEIEETVAQDDSATIGEKMFLYGLIRAIKPRIVMETGTHRGKTSLYMMNALYDNFEEDKNCKGHLFTCDPNKSYGQQQTFERFTDLKDFVTFKPVRGIDYYINEGIDLFFCDGFHGVIDVIEEIDYYFPKLKDRALVVFHDCDECFENDENGVNAAIKAKGLQYVHIMSQNRMRIYEHRVSNE